MPNDFFLAVDTSKADPELLKTLLENLKNNGIEPAFLNPNGEFLSLTKGNVPPPSWANSKESEEE